MQSQPIVDTQSSKQVEHADRVLDLFSGVRNSLQDRYTAKTLTISHRQAESLVGFVQRAVPSIKAEFDFDAKAAKAKFSYQLPSYLFGYYINLTATILPDDQLNVSRVSIGDLTVPGTWALGAAEYLVNAYTNSSVASVAIAQIDTVSMSNNRITVDLHPMDRFLNEAKNIETGGNSVQSKRTNIRIAHYIRLLGGMYIPPAKGRQSASSLSYYLHGLMEEARIRSVRDGGSATEENEAAILALAAFAGHRQFANFIGDFSFSFKEIPQASERPSLGNRKDLSLHFIFSAAIKLLSEQGVSIAVGEFKELMDRRSGGSGYSFVDLAADMSGAHFAALAVNPEYAQTLQAIMASKAQESLFFVNIAGLEEGMDKKAFKQKYGEVDSARYVAVVQDIQQRINELPISPKAQ